MTRIQKVTYICFLCALASPWWVHARFSDSLPSIEDSIAHYALAMQEAEKGDLRWEAAHHVQRFLLTALADPNSWDYPFDRVPQLSIVQDLEQTFRIFTWQVGLEAGRYKQFGLFQHVHSPQSPTNLISSQENSSTQEYNQWEADSWHGQVYYNLHPFKSKGKKYWVLFGFTSINDYTFRKIADILHIDKEGNPVFGAPFFVYRNEEGEITDTKWRIILNYAAVSQVKLNYDLTRELILFDHLMPYVDERMPQAVVHIPDGTYCGFQWKKGEWQYISKVFHEVMDEAPIEVPVLDGRKNRDIMGKEKRK